MPLPRFMLADLSAAELAQEMIRRIPAHTPEWRNAREGDPGRALIDLFAWMGETILYRVNLLPRRQRIEFLRLLNLKLRAAQPARGVLQLVPKSAKQADPVFVAEATRINGPVAFETRTPVTVQPWEGQIYIKRRLSTDERAALAEVIDSLSELYGIEIADPYETTRLFAEGLAHPRGTDPLADSVDRTVWIALLALEGSVLSRAAALAAFDRQPALLSVGVIPRLVPPDPDRSAPLPELPELFEWSISGMTSLGGGSRETYHVLAVEDDGTARLTREGTLRLVLPTADDVAAPTNDVGADEAAGVGDRPPRLDDPDIAGRLLAWVRLRPLDPGGTLPLSWLGINAVGAEQTETRRNMVLGIATGQAGQSYALPGQNIDPDSLRLSVYEGQAGFRPWRRVADLGACARDDRCFALDEEAGVVSFGDGLTGKAPNTGARIRLDGMRAGGGIEGNLPATTLKAIEVPGLEVRQPAAMSGGAAAETLEAAEKRVTATLQHRNRCVTEADYKAIAQEIDLARVEVLPRFRPFQRRSDSAGVVSAMIFPFKSAQQPPNPRPDRRLLEQVKAYLDPRRPLGTELYVIGPEYLGLGLSVAIGVAAGHAREEVVKAVSRRLYNFLWPLPPGGRGGGGWPLAAPVMNTEAEVIVAQTPGVRTTQGVRLFGMGPGGFAAAPTDPATGAQLMTFQPWQLPELLQVDVAIDAAAPATTMADRSAASVLDGAGGIAIPVVPEVC